MQHLSAWKRRFKRNLKYLKRKIFCPQLNLILRIVNLTRFSSGKDIEEKDCVAISAEKSYKPTCDSNQIVQGSGKSLD